MRKIIYKYVIFFTLIILIIVNFNKIKIDIINNSLYFIKCVFPSLFTIMIITSIIKLYLMSENKIMNLLTLAVTFSPANALFTDNVNVLLYTTIVNPFFCYYAIKLILNHKCSLFIVLINLLINYTLLFYELFVKNKNLKIANDNNDADIFCIIKNSINNILYIYGVTMFFSIIISITPDIFLLKYLKILIDISVGFNLINSLHYKIFFAAFLNSFTGISILMQQKSLNNKIDGKFVLKKLTISIIISIITYALLYCII